jgi:hypothetical protein
MPVVQPLLSGPIAPVQPGPACQESVCGQRSQPLHLFVNCVQQFRKNFIQLSRGGSDRLVAETADSIIEAAQSHEKWTHVALPEYCLIFWNSSIPYIL